MTATDYRHQAASVYPLWRRRCRISQTVELRTTARIVCSSQVVTTCQQHLFETKWRGRPETWLKRDLKKIPNKNGKEYCSIRYAEMHFAWRIRAMPGLWDRQPAYTKSTVIRNVQTWIHTFHKRKGSPHEDHLAVHRNVFCRASYRGSVR